MLVLLTVAAVARPAERANVLLIVTDDQGWGDVRSNGNQKVDTPNLDRLASEGARFERFFVDPLCAPTRAGLLTGRYYLRSGVHGVTRAYETMRAGEVTLAEVFKGAGYATGCFGKWHNGAHYPNHPNGQGFGEFVGFCGGHWNNYFDTTLERNGEPAATKGFITDVLADEAIGFMKRNAGRPFLCYVPFNAPHFPPQAPDAYFDKYKARGFGDEAAAVYGMVENADWNVGRLLASLDELGLSEKTVVLFHTDNGPNTDRYNGDMKGRKGSAHEGGVRVPLFVRWPGRVEAGRVVRPIASNVDLLPTLCELCGVPVPKGVGLDGTSLAPLLLDGDVTWPERMLFTFKDTKAAPDGKQGAVRTDRYRAVREKRQWELYDMTADPSEQHDLAGERPEVVRELAAAFEAKWKEVSAAGFDPVPVEVGHPGRPAVTLPGHEAILHPAQGEGISYHGPAGWANDWIDNWTDAAAYAAWPVEVVTPGEYEVTVRYCCPAENVGAEFRAEVGGAAASGTVTEAYDPEPLPSPDRAPRHEVYEKTWRPLSLGTMRLAAGRTELVLRAEKIVGGRMPQVKGVEVRPVR